MRIKESFRIVIDERANGRIPREVPADVRSAIVLNAKETLLDLAAQGKVTKLLDALDQVGVIACCPKYRCGSASTVAAIRAAA